MFDPASPAATRDLLREIGVVPNRTLGQNFLVNGGALDRIVTTAGVCGDDSVLEIGPGLGSLTCRLVRSAARVTAIEKDPPLLELLRRHLPAENLRLVGGDALRVEWSTLELPPHSVKVVANLPYSISKPMLRRLMEEWRAHFSSLTILVQREVADRIVADAGTSAYGPMALMAQLHGVPRRVFDIRPGSFLPPPQVVSSVVHIDVRQTPRVKLNNEAFFWRLVRAAFGQRRKQLGNTLRAVIADKDVLANTLRDVNVDPQRRGETLSLEEFAALANQLSPQHETMN